MSKYVFNSRDDLAVFVNTEIIDTTEARVLLGCSRQNINDLISRGKLKPVKVLPKTKLFFKSDILARV